jgi:ABC-type bacteriocin/lantibiotic exporter with double-glycine peptidase domain
MFSFAKVSALPHSIMGYVFRYSGKHQIGLAALAVAVFALSTVPLELQRRIINDAIKSGATGTILWLAAAYAGVALAEQGLKLILNVYRGWVSEAAVRRLRKLLEVSPEEQKDVTGTRVAMMVDEALPIGGFVGMSVSEPLLQGGILASVIGYMVCLEPYMALLSLAFLVPQMVFVPLMQRAINRRAADRIRTVREVSSDMIDTGTAVDAQIERVFSLNMGVYKIKYSMNLLMNLMHYFAVAVALGVGGWFAVAGRIEVGTVVAVVAGLGKLNDPWGDLVSWGREFSVVGVKYRLFADVLGQRTRQ